MSDWRLLISKAIVRIWVLSLISPSRSRMSLPRGVSERCLHEDVDAALSVAVAESVVLQEVAEDLGEVRLAGAEETRHPHAHDVAAGAAAPQRLADQREGVEDALQLVFDLVGDDVLAHLAGERGSVEDLDDAFDLHADVALDDVPYGGHSANLPRSHRSATQRQNSLTAR